MNSKYVELTFVESLSYSGGKRVGKVLLTILIPASALGSSLPSHSSSTFLENANNSRRGEHQIPNETLHTDKFPEEKMNVERSALLHNLV